MHLTGQSHSALRVLPHLPDLHSYVGPCVHLGPLHMALRHVANLRKWIGANLHGLITLLFYKVINESDFNLRAACGGAEGLAGISCEGKSDDSPALGPAALTAEGCGFTQYNPLNELHYTGLSMNHPPPPSTHPPTHHCHGLAGRHNPQSPPPAPCLHCCTLHFLILLHTVNHRPPPSSMSSSRHAPCKPHCR